MEASDVMTPDRKVSQDAREAAADWYVALWQKAHGNIYGWMCDTENSIRSGRTDDDSLVQAFARFEEHILARPSAYEDIARANQRTADEWRVKWEEAVGLLRTLAEGVDSNWLDLASEFPAVSEYLRTARAVAGEDDRA
jgi:hypothetical protein